ncbi:pentapeptide repeat-containing protein [Desulfomarina sp.]
MQRLIKTNSCRGCDLSGVNLNRVDLSHADLEGANLEQARLYLTDLSSANLRNANLKGVVFGGTDLGGADLRGADLRGAVLDGAYLGGALLDGMIVTTQLSEHSDLTGIEQEVYVEDPGRPKKNPVKNEVIVRKRRVLREPPPVLKKMRISKPEGTYPKPPEIKKALMPGKINLGTEIDSREVRKKKFRSGESIVQAEHKKENIAPDKEKTKVLKNFLDTNRCYGCDLSGIDFSGKDLEGSDLEKADLTGCSFAGADMEGANLKGAVLVRADFRGADLRGADLYKADLTGANMAGARVENTLFDGAVLPDSYGKANGLFLKPRVDGN